MSVHSRSPSARPAIGELLVREGLIDDTQLAVALAEQRQWGQRLGAELVRLGYLSEDELIRVLGRQMGLPIVRLAGKRIDREVLDLVPEGLAQKHRCLPLFVRDERGVRVLQLALEDPANVVSLDELRFALDMEVAPVLVAPSDLDDALRRHYRNVTAGAHAETLGAADVGSPAEPAPPERGSSAPAVPLAVTVRALAQLLVEKGILGRDELVERIGRLTAEIERDEL